MNLALRSTPVGMGQSKNDAMNHTRAASAGPRISLDRAPISLLTSANARCLIVRQRISHLRERGVIISDAEAKYQRWLAISAGNSPRPDLPSRPSTAMAGLVRPNKASLLRRDHLPKACAEPDYKMIARSRRAFDRRCKSASVTVTSMMSREPESETLHEFLIGARYNCTHHIDSLSLERLGVYVPRANVAGTFINPAGIIPPSKKYRQAQGRMSLSQTLDAPTVAMNSFSAGLYGLSMKKGSMSDIGSDISTNSSRNNECDSITLLPQDVVRENTESQVCQGPGNEAESEVPAGVTDPSTSTLAIAQQCAEVSDENQQLLISEYAQKLTEEILRHSLAQSTHGKCRDDDSPLRGITVDALCEQLSTAEKNSRNSQTTPLHGQAVEALSGELPTVQRRGGNSQTTSLRGLTIEALCGQHVTVQKEGKNSQTDTTEVLPEQLPNQTCVGVAGVEVGVEANSGSVGHPLSRTGIPNEFRSDDKLEGEMKLTSGNSSNSCLEGGRSSKEICASSEHSLLASRKSEVNVRKSSSTIFIDLMKLQEHVED